ncbi:hypothetical protein [Pseudomonas syringae]|uniref:hypothetical protein n=1 Tax=Pseudomonas syringae TaxID=317 RepID=UPI000AF78FBF|nr:hypothetical protein [Pseudomonas syringae]
MDLVEFLLALSKQLLTLFWAGSHITLAKRRCRLFHILDFHRPLRPFSQPLGNDRFIKRLLFQVAPDDKVIVKDGFFEVGKLRITGQLDGHVLIVFALVADARFTVGGRQLIERLTAGHVLFDHLLNQRLLELPILTVEVIALVPGQHACGISNVYPNMLSG